MVEIKLLINDRERRCLKANCSIAIRNRAKFCKQIRIQLFMLIFLNYERVGLVVEEVIIWGWRVFVWMNEKETHYIRLLVMFVMAWMTCVNSNWHAACWVVSLRVMLEKWLKLRHQMYLSETLLAQRISD